MILMIIILILKGLDGDVRAVVPVLPQAPGSLMDARPDVVAQCHDGALYDNVSIYTYVLHINLSLSIYIYVCMYTYIYMYI